MFKRALVASTTAALIAAGSLAATATTASATGTVHGGLFFGGPGWHFGITTPRTLPRTQPRWVCTPEYRYVPYWSFGRINYRLVQVGQDCHWVWPRHPVNRAWPFGW